MPHPHAASHCEICDRLPELLARAAQITVHDGHLSELVEEIGALVAAAEQRRLVGVGESCMAHRTLLVDLQPSLKRIYESLLLERLHLRNSIAELTATQSWSGHVKTTIDPPETVNLLA